MCKDVQMSPSSVYEIPAPFKKNCFTDLEMTTAVLTIVAYTLAMLIAIGFCAGFNSKNCFSDILALRNTNKNTSENLPAETAETGSLLSAGQGKDDKIDSNSQTDTENADTFTESLEEDVKGSKPEKSMKKYFTAVKTSSEKFAQKYFNLNKSENQSPKTPEEAVESTSDIPPVKPSRDRQSVTPDK